MNGHDLASRTMHSVDHDPFGEAAPSPEHASAQIALKPVDFDPFAEAASVGDHPTTDSQRELWLSAQMGEGASCAYIQSFTLCFRGGLHVDHLSGALQSLAGRHEALRSTISACGTRFTLMPSFALEMPVVDLTDRTEDERRSETERLERLEVTTPFDLLHGPFLRATLIRKAVDEHLLLLTVHHIVADGWSVGLLLQELGTLYSAAVRGESADLLEPDGFCAFAEDVAAAAHSEETSEARAYWQAVYQSPVEPLALPTDRPRPPVKTFNGGRVSRLLDGAFTSNLKQLGSRHGCTQAGTFMAAFMAFLHRLTGQSDLVVGMPSAGQAMTGKTRLVGHCVNVLPLRQQVDGQGSFAGLLKSLRGQLLDAFDNTQVTMGRVLESLQLHRDPSRLPLTSVILNHMEHETELDFEGLELSYSYRPRAFEIFEWQVNVEMLPDGVDLQLSYNTDLFDQETIERRLEEYETLMRALVAAPDAPMDSLPLLGTAERALLDRFNDTASHSTPPEQPEGLVHERMALQVGRTPDAAAVEFEGRALSYAELDGCANRLARHLVEQGFGPGQLAAICVNRSPWMVVSLLAVLKAGGAYVPLDPGYPAARLSYILEDSEAAVMLTEGAVSGGLPKHGARTVLLDAPGLLDFGDADPLGIDVSGASIAYVIYTSGSTGKPKGVEVPHSALANFLASMAREPGLGPDDVLVAVTTLAFDIAGLELFLPLVTGAKLVLASRQVAADGESLMALLARCDATIMQATPATWRLMIEAGWAGDNGLRALCGGEAITPELVAELRPRCKELWNMYGPTETTIWSTVARLEVGEPVTIGRPIDNTQVHVLDDNMQRLPIGVTGELYIGGAGVARGYRHRPGLTAERFVRDHFGVGSAPRLYRTGDLGRYRSDGQLECLGRRDHQVKIRGYRIELGEIEAVLEQHSDVREAVVVDREDERVGRYLVAWFVSHADEPPSRRELREHLGRQLPDYMIPPVFSELDAIPRLPNGKVDRAALPRSRGSRVEVERHLAEPRDDFELRLQSLWKNVLGVESVGITDNFFDLGGHSLLAMRLLAEIEASFGISLALPRLVEAPTIEHLADLFRKGEVPAKLDELLLIREPTGGATRPPIFCICGIFLYRDLAQRMHPEHPVYAVFLQSELDLIHAGDGRAWPSTEDMAAKYLELVRRVQPEGPYFITGVSFGGVLAFEMAQQLRADGQEVGLVALLDTPCTGDKRPSIMKRAIFHARQVRQQGAEYLTRRLRLGGQDEQPLLEVEPVQVGTGAQQTKRFGSARQRLFLDAMRRYQARPYDGRIELFLASRRSEAEALLGDPMLAWRAVASGRLMVHTVPGDHLGILRAPDVEVLARKLQTSVDAVLEERAG